MVCGTPTTIQRGKGIIDDFRKQVLGLSAPAGGLIFVVPADLVSRIHVMEPNFVKLQQKLGAQLTKLPSGRIKVTGSNQPEVVGQLLRWLGHRGQILFLGPIFFCLLGKHAGKHEYVCFLFIGAVAFDFFTSCCKL